MRHPDGSSAALTVAKMVVRLAVGFTLLLLAYYHLPIHDDFALDLPWLLITVGLFAAIVLVQVPLILRARHPFFRAVEALALTVGVYLLVFARIYASTSAADPAAFNAVLDRTTALYFSVTVFATVGFGDIAPVANALKMVVTVQMLLNLIMIGVVVRLLITVGRRGMERRYGSD